MINISDFNKYLESPEKLGIESLVSLKETVSEYPNFQLAWMLILKNILMVSPEEFETYLQRASFYITDRRKLYLFLHIEDKEAKRELIQISKEYTTSSGSYLEPNKLQKESLGSLAKSLRSKKRNDTEVENKPYTHTKNDFVTETLAKIFIKQSMYKEAIASYKKLSLKYPEKNAYFASRIKEIIELTK